MTSQNENKSEPFRYVSREGRPNIRRRGFRYRQARDGYHWMMTLGLPSVIGLIALLFLIINAGFAALYMMDPGCIVGADPHSFWDYFFFSVQTFGTIGYGHMWPQGRFANGIMAVQSFLNFCSFGVITGLLFSRFSRPSAQLMFSQHAVIGLYEGKPTLMFRAANQRGNQLLQAQVHVSLSRDEKTLEGESVRRLYDLKILRPTSAYFNLTWTIRHTIDEASPLFGVTPETLRDNETEIIVLLSGVDDIYGQLVHGRFAFNHEEILFGYRFVNMFEKQGPDGPIIDYNKFNSVERIAAWDPACLEKRD